MTKSKSPHQRPFSVTLLALGVLTFTGINLLRLSLAIEQWGFLAGVLPVSPLYLAFTGLIWALVGLPLAWGLWRGRKWSPAYARLGAIAYLLFYWLDRLILADTVSRHANWPFALGGTLLVLALILWILSRRKAKAFFGEIYDQ